jgi:hypothetical protein
MQTGFCRRENSEKILQKEPSREGFYRYNVILSARIAREEGNVIKILCNK